MYSSVKKTEQKYQLAPYVSVGYTSGILKFGFGSIQKAIAGEPLQKAVISLADYLLQSRTIEEIRNACFEKLSEGEATSLFSLLTEGHFLIPEGHYVKKDRYSRHALFYNLSGGDPQEIQRTLRTKTVAIVGCGGIGNLVSASLATAGVGKLILVDDDVIELSNLTRQLMFCEQDVGMLKAELLKQQLEARASNVTIDVHDARLDSAEKFFNLPNSDLVVVSGDSSHICFDANVYCFQRGIPFINVGYIQDIAIWGPFIIPGQTPCYQCFSYHNISDKPLSDSIDKTKIQAINKNYQAPSIGPVNMLAASHASLDILKFLGGFGTIHSIGQRIGNWTHSLEMQFQKYTAQEACCICGNFQTLHADAQKRAHKKHVA